jgi:hypothetical protein
MSFRLLNIAPLRPEFLATFLIEWPKSEPAPTKFWLACRNMSFRDLVDLAKLRWRNRVRLSRAQAGHVGLRPRHQLLRAQNPRSLSEG